MLCRKITRCRSWIRLDDRLRVALHEARRSSDRRYGAVCTLSEPHKGLSSQAPAKDRDRNKFRAGLLNGGQGQQSCEVGANFVEMAGRLNKSSARTEN